MIENIDHYWIPCKTTDGRRGSIHIETIAAIFESKTQPGKWSDVFIVGCPSPFAIAAKHDDLMEKMKAGTLIDVATAQGR